MSKSIYYYIELIQIENALILKLVW